jgi:hypothetical protein
MNAGKELTIFVLVVSQIVKPGNHIILKTAPGLRTIRDPRVSVRNFFCLKFAIGFGWLQSLRAPFENIKAHKTQPQNENCGNLDPVHNKVCYERADVSRRVVGTKYLRPTNR